MIANETNLHKRPKDTEINNYIGHRTAFNNEQSSSRIVSYKKGPEMTNVEQFKREN